MNSKLLLLLIIASVLFGCNKNEENSSSSKNELSVKINGKDTVFEIWQAKIKQFDGYQQLSIITPAGLKQIDFYCVDEILEINKPLIERGYLTLEMPQTAFYFRSKNNPSETYYSSILTSRYIDDTYNVIITKLTSNEIEGTLNIVVSPNTELETLIEGTFKSNKLIYE